MTGKDNMGLQAFPSPDGASHLQHQHPGQHQSQQRQRQSRASPNARAGLRALGDFIASDIKLFFAPALLGLVKDILIASVLFLAIGLIAVFLQYLTALMMRYDVSSEFTTALTYLAQLLIWLDVACLTFFLVATTVKQLRNLAASFKS